MKREGAKKAKVAKEYKDIKVRGDRVHGALWLNAPYPLVFSCCRAVGGYGGPRLHGHRWLAKGQGVPKRNWSVFPRGRSGLFLATAGSDT